MIHISLHRGAMGTVAAVLAGGAFATSASAAAGTPTRVPDNPLAGNAACAPIVARSTSLGSINYPDAEVEPYKGAAPGSSGGFERATDPWVSISSDGKTAYSISDSFNANGPAFGGASSIIISRSTDRGLHWDAPVTARIDTSTTVLNDKESITADPVNPTAAYAVWDRLVSPSQNANPSAFIHSPAFRGPAMFSKTTDGGLSWSTGRPIFDPGEKNQTIGNQIVIPTAGPASGQLIDGFDLILTKGGRGNNQRESNSVAIIRSTDGGSSWSGPIIAATEVPAPVVINRTVLRTADILPELKAGPEGNLYAVWQDGALHARRDTEDRVHHVDGRRRHLERSHQDRRLAWRHAGVHAADQRSLRRHRGSPVLRPGERHDDSTGSDRSVRRDVSQSHEGLLESRELERRDEAQQHGAVQHPGGAEHHQRRGVRRRLRRAGAERDGVRLGVRDGNADRDERSDRPVLEHGPAVLKVSGPPRRWRRDGPELRV